MSLRSAIALSLLVAGCGAEAPVPDKPTWTDDVKPILQGNCFGCHGAGANPEEERFRWDVFNFDLDPKYAELGFPATFFRSPSSPGQLSMILGRVTAADVPLTPMVIARMPPPPAIRLSAREIEVLQKWSDTGLSHGEHHPNHKPRIAWVAKPLFQVIDDDHDQVLGNLDCGGKLVPIPSTGGFKLPDDAKLPCTARLYDGFEEGGGPLQ
jgi:hypothetical protein